MCRFVTNQLFLLPEALPCSQTGDDIMAAHIKLLNQSTPDGFNKNIPGSAEAVLCKYANAHLTVNQPALIQEDIDDFAGFYRHHCRSNIQ